jgi:hypothetical protein
MENNELTTSRGKTLRIKALPSLQVQLVEQAAQKQAVALYGEAKRPTYTVIVAGGDTETNPHDETTLEVEGNPEETAANKAAWAEYKRIGRLQQNHVLEKLRDFYFLQGVEVDIPPDGEWMEVQRFFGVEIPEDPIGRRLHYIYSEALGGADDVERVISSIMAATGIGTEMIAAAAASFRGTVRSRRDAATRTAQSENA